jgi:hypothetical protein
MFGRGLRRMMCSPQRKAVAISNEISLSEKWQARRQALK